MNGSDAPAFLDTNYLIRYFTCDPPEMADQAALVIDSEEPLILSEYVILECAHVLSSVYKISRQEIVEALIDLVERQSILLPVLPKSRVLAALELCHGSKRYSFTDAFLWAQALEMGTGRRIYTFDNRFPSEGVRLIRPGPDN